MRASKRLVINTYRYRHIDIQTYTNTYVLQTRTQKLLKPEKSKRNKQSLNELNEHTAHQNIRQQPTKWKKKSMLMNTHIKFQHNLFSWKHLSRWLSCMPCFRSSLVCCVRFHFFPVRIFFIRLLWFKWNIIFY